MKAEIKKAAEGLAYTSVDDARSSLKCAEQTGKPTRESLEILQEAISLLRIREEAGYFVKTKIKLFESTLKRWRKIVSAP
ncbi:MAG: hypothetical protein ABS95_02205 [Verrucomicrobia bacterium SCN 57-15]|nr:MAG: hypothetical protein ABS95_02205 [Verrucomicrobia bacterium SCN 57-15]